MKTNKTTKSPKNKIASRTKSTIMGAVSLVIVLAELSAAYVLWNQDSNYLRGIAVILGAHAIVKLADKFVR